MGEPTAHTHGSQDASFVVLAGAEIGLVLPLTNAVHTLGRAAGTDLRIAGASISRKHALVRRLSAGKYEIEDLGSQNGTRVNGEPIVGACALRSGDRIQLGPRVILQFSVSDVLDRRLRQAEDLETASRLSEAVNHDLNNLLSVVTCGLAHLATLDPNTTLGDADVTECLGDMLFATRRAAELTQRLHTLVRSPARERNRVDVSELCNGVVRALQRTLPVGIRLEAHIEPNLVVDGNRAWLHQLVMQPCINARDAMPSGGVLRIDVRVAQPNEVARRPDLAAGPHLVIAISDTGVGIAPEILSQVFQPFFTTKGAGKGTGLGLATVARAADDHGGAVDLVSHRGVGTSLRIFLPRVEATPARAGASIPTDAPA